MRAAGRRVEIGRNRRALAGATVLALALAAYGLWNAIDERSVTGWLVTLGGLLAAAVCGYLLARNRPRLVITDAGIEWRGSMLPWHEIDDVRETSIRAGLATFRVLAIRSRGSVMTVDLSGLERSADDILRAIEEASGRAVTRTP